MNEWMKEHMSKSENACDHFRLHIQKKPNPFITYYDMAKAKAIFFVIDILI